MELLKSFSPQNTKHFATINKQKKQPNIPFVVIFIWYSKARPARGTQEEMPTFPSRRANKEKNNNKQAKYKKKMTKKKI